MFDSGEIVLAKFPFTSLQSSKRRPCLILTKGDSVEDFIVAFITSSQVPNHFRFTIKLSPQEKDFLQTGLKSESFIRIDKLATINQNLISGAIGRLTPSMQAETNRKLKMLFNI